MCETKRYIEPMKGISGSNDNVEGPKLKPYERVIIGVLEKIGKFGPINKSR